MDPLSLLGNVNNSSRLAIIAGAACILSILIPINLARVIQHNVDENDEAIAIAQAQVDLLATQGKNTLSIAESHLKQMSVLEQRIDTLIKTSLSNPDAKFLINYYAERIKGLNDNELVLDYSDRNYKLAAESAKIDSLNQNNKNNLRLFWLMLGISCFLMIVGAYLISTGMKVLDKEHLDMRVALSIDTQLKEHQLKKIQLEITLLEKNNPSIPIEKQVD